MNTVCYNQSVNNHLIVRRACEMISGRPTRNRIHLAGQTTCGRGEASSLQSTVGVGLQRLWYYSVYTDIAVPRSNQAICQLVSLLGFQGYYTTGATIAVRTQTRLPIELYICSNIYLCAIRQATSVWYGGWSSITRADVAAGSHAECLCPGLEKEGSIGSFCQIMLAALTLKKRGERNSNAHSEKDWQNDVPHAEDGTVFSDKDTTATQT
jgi:hypothetical protein